MVKVVLEYSQDYGCIRFYHIEGISSQLKLAAEEYRVHHPLVLFRTVALHHLDTPSSTWLAQQLYKIYAVVNI